MDPASLKAGGGLIELAHAIGRNTTLRHIDLRRTSLTHAAAQATSAARCNGSPYPADIVTDQTAGLIRRSSAMW
jgi:hypothetical protein